MRYKLFLVIFLLGDIIFFTFNVRQAFYYASQQNLMVILYFILAVFMGAIAYRQVVIIKLDRSLDKKIEEIKKREEEKKD